MKPYPSTSHAPVYTWVHMFDKLDGSNIRVEYSRKNGFSKFGTRKRLLGTDQPQLYPSIEYFKNNWEESLLKICKDNRWDKCIFFFEWVGDNSFAGQHDENEKQKLILIDVNPFKKGIMDPKQFMKTFGHLDIAKYLGFVKINKVVEQSIKEDTYSEDITFEGVVCKWYEKGRFKSFKIKSTSWLTRLKNRCGDDVNLFNKLK